MNQDDIRIEEPVEATPAEPELGPPRDPLIGALLGGRYRIIEVISSGGVGTVYRAEQTTLVRRGVAVKLLRPAFLAAYGRVERFEHEARITAQLKHPNTVRVLDSGRLENGQLYLVTELLEGISLEDAITAGPVTPLRTVRIARQIAASLREAHEVGVIHRDLKPSNVYLETIGGQEIVKVLDFGMAKLIGLPGLTLPMTLCGTPGYMAPEQILGLKIDQRADIYALGVLMYQCIAGVPPFISTCPMDLLAKHVDDAPEPLWTHVDIQLHPGLEAIVMRMLGKSPEGRPQSMAEVDAALELLERELYHFLARERSRNGGERIEELIITEDDEPTVPEQPHPLQRYRVRAGGSAGASPRPPPAETVRGRRRPTLRALR